MRAQPAFCSRILASILPTVHYDPPSIAITNVVLVLLQVSSIVGEISLSAVTDDDSTFVSWSTEHSNDVDSDFMGEFRCADIMKNTYT